MSTVLVTGGAGFIGSHLAARLLADGHTVRVLDNLSTGRRENVAGIRENVEFTEGDIRDEGLVADLVRGVELVYHFAAIPSVPKSVTDPAGTHDVNVGGTIAVFVAAKGAGVKRLVFASSSSIYGDGAPVPTGEDSPPRPASPYGLQKHCCEHMCRLYNTQFGVETVALRFFNVFGERQDEKSQYAAVIPNFLTRLMRGEPPRIFGDGEQTRDFTYVANAVEASLLAAAHPKAAGQVFNVATGSAITVNELAKACMEAAGKKIEPEYLPERPGDIKFSGADISRAGMVLGYAPIVSFREGLALTAGFFRGKQGNKETRK